MKKIFVLFFVIVTCNFAQYRNNGNISFVFNKEILDLPINSVTLSKDSGIVLTIEAEKQDSNVQQIVRLDIGLNKLSAGPNAENLDDTEIIIKSHHIKTDSGKELSVSFKNDELIDSKNNFEKMHYGIYDKGQRISLGITSVSLKIDITEVQLKDGLMYIKGEFNGECKSNAAPAGQTAEIKNGKFDIIF